jgi:hypothetical protein
MMITDRLIIAKISSRNALPRLASASTSRKRIDRIISAQVATMPTVGVPNRPSLSNPPQVSRSLAIASG